MSAVTLSLVAIQIAAAGYAIGRAIYAAATYKPSRVVRVVKSY